MSRTSRTNAIVGLSSGLVGPVLGPLLAVALLLSVCAVPALAQEHAPRPEHPERTERGASTEQPADPQGVLRLLPADATSDKSITIAGRTLAYTATAGTLSLYDQNGERTAAVFYTAYVLKDSANPSATPRNISADAARNTAANDNTARPDRSSRPVTFAFNGGPGAASACRASSAGRADAVCPLARGSGPAVRSSVRNRGRKARMSSGAPGGSGGGGRCDHRPPSVRAARSRGRCADAIGGGGGGGGGRLACSDRRASRALSRRSSMWPSR